MTYDIRILNFLFPLILFTTATIEIHLTFDDGPHPLVTPILLRILKERNIRATFFLVGQHVQEYPDLARQITAEGHQVGSHSYIHSKLLFRNKEFIHDQIQRSQNILETTFEQRIHIFRPPYGYFNFALLQVLKEFNLQCVLWSINSKDYQPYTEGSVQRRVLPHVVPGSILLLHDNHHTVETLERYFPPLLDLLHEKGFQFNILPI